MVLTVDGKELTQLVKVEPDPLVPDTRMTVEEIEALEADEKAGRTFERNRALYGTRASSDDID